MPIGMMVMKSRLKLKESGSRLLRNHFRYIFLIILYSLTRPTTYTNLYYILLQAVLDIGVGKSTALLQCNEVLKIVADSFYDLLACPCRCDTNEELSDMDKEFELDLPWGEVLHARSGDQEDIWAYVWVALLRVHSNEGADEELLLRCIKDAHDNMRGVDMELPGVLYDKGGSYYDLSRDDVKDGKDVPDGKKLAQLVKDNASAWQGLATTKKVHRMRRAIDRRFDGSPERRTRDYHLYDNDGDDSSYDGYGGGYGGGRGGGQRDCVIS